MKTYISSRLTVMWRSLRLFLSGTATHLFFIRKLTLDMFYHIYHKMYSPFSTSPPTTNKKERKKWVDGWVGGCADEWMGEWIGGWMDGLMHGWMVACKLVAWVNGRTDREGMKSSHAGVQFEIHKQCSVKAREDPPPPAIKHWTNEWTNGRHVNHHPLTRAPSPQKDSNHL